MMDGIDGADLVVRICEQIGYGRVMQIASEAWRGKNPKGAISMGECFGTIEHAAKRGTCAYCEQKLKRGAP